MFRKFLVYIAPALLLLLFVFIMSGGNILKKPMGANDRVFESIKSLEHDVKTKNWVQAKQEINYATKAWNRVVNRIQYSVEREYMLDISGALARIKGGIEAQDEKAIMEEIYFFYDLWENLGK